jgi:hypothetical protein
MYGWGKTQILSHQNFVMLGKTKNKSLVDKCHVHLVEQFSNSPQFVLTAASFAEFSIDWPSSKPSVI